MTPDTLTETFNATEKAYINGAITREQMMEELGLTEEDIEREIDQHGDQR